MIDQSEAISRVQSGESMAEVGRALGVTRARVQQVLVKTLGRDEVQRLIKQQRLDRKLDARVAATKAAQTAVDEAIANGQVPACVTCLKPAYRKVGGVAKEGRAATCSTECAKLWIIVRYHIDPKRKAMHHTSMAEMWLQYPEKATPAQLKWAKRYVNGEAKTRIIGAISEGVKNALARVDELRRA